MKHIGNEIDKIIRNNPSLKTKDVAELVGISREYMSNIKKKSSIDCELLDKIAKVLNVPVSYFFDETTYSTVIGNQNQINNGVGDQIFMSAEQREIENLKELLKEKERFIQHLLNQNK
ncbi:helix-turn-helix domain-containing protein [Gabonia massiliensis]|uniref:helix-turn-helix domain-containing protein n=1 Tax=Gabonia massiliensis TaxID=1686296 RepID=UPI0006D7C333|nr:helix-turn-helix transcriptional regulator [Gabonia massiliensis]